MIDINDCKSLNDIARKLFQKTNYTNREKVKKYLLENGIDWKEFLSSCKEKNISYCQQCGKPLKRGQNKFCCRNCAASYNNHLRNGVFNNRPQETSFEIINEENNIIPSKNNVEKEKYCLFCGNRLNNRQDKFCTSKCQQDYRYIQYIEKWKCGEEDGIKGEYGISAHIRRYLFDKNNSKCEICGWGQENQFTHKIPLEIHHKDGDYTNNNEENLQLLCPNCHSLTETFKSHNKNGRKERKKYF